MGTRGLLRLLTTTACLAMGSLATGSTPALASSGDTAATQAYVQAGYAALRVVNSHLASFQAGPVHLIAQVQHECPLVGVNSPQDSDSTQMSNEVIGAIVVAVIAPDLQANRTFVKSVAGLHWSNSGLTHAIHTYTSNVATLSGLSAPNLCGDVKAWGADGYHALPTSTVTFVAKFMPAWVAAGFLPAQLTRTESSATRALARRCNQLEQRIGEAEARAVAQYSEVMNALAIWP